MERAAAAQVGLGDQTANLAAMLLPQRIQFGLIGGQVDRLFAAFEIDALLSRERDEFHARIALGILFAAGDGAGQSLLAVKAVASGKNDVFAWPPIHSRPERLLDRLAAAGGPQDLLATGAALLAPQAGHQSLGRQSFDFGQTVVGIERHRRAELAFARQVCQAQIVEHPAPPIRRIVAQVHHQHARGEVGQPAPFGRPMAASGAFGQHRHTRRKRAQAMRFDRRNTAADVIGLRFAKMFDRFGRFRGCDGHGGKRGGQKIGVRSQELVSQRFEFEVKTARA